MLKWSDADVAQSYAVLKGRLAKGDTLGNLRHGHGRLSCASGDGYTGSWHDGKRDGTGHAVFDKHKSTEDDKQPKPVCYNGSMVDMLC
ncbi:TPA: hypothetical protein ACH3X2_000101 [Trebouxia sp. C0005]